jgi:hypothetical protein
MLASKSASSNLEVAMRSPHAPVLGVVVATIVLLSGLCPDVGSADEYGIRVVRVEETWELHLADPDPNSTAPQVTCAFAPLRNLDSFHATFELNHQATPEFSPGGLHLHAWNGDQRLDSRHEGTGSLRTDGEVVRWKQVLTLDDGTLAFEIADGSSTTWGDFGADQRLRIAVPTTLANLNFYSPSVSVQQSGVAFAGNRVVRLVMTNVKAITAAGVVFEDGTDRIAHDSE